MNLYANGLIEVYWDGDWKWGYNLKDYTVVCDHFDLDSDGEFRFFIAAIGIEDFILDGWDMIEQGVYQFFAAVDFHYYSSYSDCGEDTDVEYDDYKIVLRKVNELDS